MRADGEAVMAPFAHNWRRQIGRRYPGRRIEDGNSAAITGELNIHFALAGFRRNLAVAAATVPNWRPIRLFSL
jgi:hypothetical protein